MRLETTGRKELVRWVLSWMPDVKALAPKSLRDRIAGKLRDGLRAFLTMPNTGASCHLPLRIPPERDTHHNVAATYF
jgi:hypothetical protein